MENVKVSIIMPAYNAAQFIENAIASVQAQTVSEWELLVIDDCSTDATAEIVMNMAYNDERIHLIQNSHNSGPAHSRNRGMELSKGKYVAFLDSDDFWYPEKLEKQLNLAEKTRAEILYCSYSIVNEKNEACCKDYLVPEKVTFEDLLKQNVIGCSTVMISRRAAILHRFHLNFYHEDYVLWLELLNEGFRACGCTEVLAVWRHMEDSRSFNKINSAKMRWKVYRKFLNLPIWKSIWCFGQYALYGLKKYFSKR